MGKHLFLAVALLLLGRLEAAVACSYAPGHEPPSDDVVFAKASAVFLARVVRVEEAGLVSVRELMATPPWMKKEAPPPKAVIEAIRHPAIEATFRVIAVFKGQPPSGGEIRAPRWYMCGGPIILAGAVHVFVLYDDAFVGSHTEARSVPDRVSVEPYLEKLRELAKKQQQ